MFVGHYSVAFAARSERNKIQLWVLFVAVQFLDSIWATLVLLGVEKLRLDFLHAVRPRCIPGGEDREQEAN